MRPSSRLRQRAPPRGCACWHGPRCEEERALLLCGSSVFGSYRVLRFVGCRSGVVLRETARAPCACQRSERAQ
eukprot:11166614-Lingulodinium_polyedra.AAC.1